MPLFPRDWEQKIRKAFGNYAVQLDLTFLVKLIQNVLEVKHTIESVLKIYEIQKGYAS
jgi:hypothetical protein